MKKEILLLALFISLAFCQIAQAQTTEFNYQGSLEEGPNQATGNYDFEFRLFDALAAGGQIGPLLTRTNVAVANGTFAVKLDFGNFFNGADRFLEIRVRNAGGTGYTVLDPRQRVGSSPYAIKSLLAETATNATTATNANQLGGVPANQYVTTASGTTSYIQNTTSPQAASSFNISGTGTANILNAVSQYNLGGNRVLAVTGTEFEQNFFAGIGSGASNTTGGFNAFFGTNAGLSNTTGNENSFIGRSAGLNNISGHANAFFGRAAGQTNTTGGGNTFAGMSSGRSNTTGNNNTAIGFEAEFGAGNLSYATAIGSNAIASNSNSVVLGRTADTVRIPGNLITTGNSTVNGNFVVSSGGVAVFSSPVTLAAGSLGTAGGTSLCRNADSQIASCSSSLRYKTNVHLSSLGLDLVKQLKPVTFDWKKGEMHDLGLGAEDVAAIEPLLVTYNNDGQVEGVKYDRIGVVLVNAVKEQQEQIERQQSEIDFLRQIVCELKPSAKGCSPK